MSNFEETLVNMQDLNNILNTGTNVASDAFQNDHQPKDFLKNFDATLVKVNF